jgi:chromosome segregation ATPase
MNNIKNLEKNLSENAKNYIEISKEIDSLIIKFENLQAEINSSETDDTSQSKSNNNFFIVAFEENIHILIEYIKEIKTNNFKNSLKIKELKEFHKIKTNEIEKKRETAHKINLDISEAENNIAELTENFNELEKLDCEYKNQISNLDENIKNEKNFLDDTKNSFTKVDLAKIENEANELFSKNVN